MERNTDQAEDLREQVKIQAEQEEIRRSALPPRSEVHKHRNTKKIQIHYPVVRLLVVLFFVIVILAFTFPYWIEKL